MTTAEQKARKLIASRSTENTNIISQAVKKGTPFPDNATNGDIITAMLLTDKDDIDIKDNEVFINNFQMIIDREFWFAPFKGGNTDATD